MGAKRKLQGSTLTSNKRRKTVVSSSEDEDDIPDVADSIVAIDVVVHPHSGSLHVLRSIQTLRAELLKWFDKVRDVRGMPWRQPFPESSESRAQRAYEVWVSEIMLQQTQVATVIPYYNRWMEKFPTIHDLAASDIDTVNGLWKGLGYYSRAARLLSGAKKVVSEFEGKLPADVKILEKEIPGIGRYSAGAICSIAHGLCVPVLDGNVHRLLSRVLAIYASPKAKRTLDLLWAGAEEMVKESGNPGDVNQALIELGSTVCKVKDPICESCPLKAGCGAYQYAKGSASVPMDIEDLCEICEPIPKGISVTRFPMKAIKKKARVETDAVNVVQWNGDGQRYFALIRRPDGGLLAGLYEFPTLENIDEDKKDILELPHSILDSLLSNPPPRYERRKGKRPASSSNGDNLQITDIQDLGNTIHIFSHIKKTYRIISVILQGGSSPPALRIDDLQQQVKKGKPNDVRTVNNIGARAKWVPEKDVADANIGTGVMNVWKKARSSWKSKED
ncbi:hypothetical protein M422DRAFT_68891 [Sphaerobolus stellatus SS14]|uniref:Adenine DNA glycosylase n=1 Tax=Sphaerobolus stellatus (strain SS14) TaxID=990650 RepID=A0A0C9U7P8_SPHS4|nr:hypothetical protein M422DRAFT_68891 [Sphaerobolus stellatus SS14]